MQTIPITEDAGSQTDGPARRAPIPENEEARLEALLRYEVLDSVSEQEFDDLTLLASYICQTPIATITLIDRSRQWFKSRIGLPGQENPREFSFCAHAILQTEPMLVSDATEDSRFVDNPLVTGDPQIRFYAGVSLRTAAEGLALGTLCVIDRIPRKLSETQIQLLEALARQVEAQFELRLKLIQEKRLSRIDPLTGAANRRAFYEVLDAEIARLMRYRRPMSVAYIDLDNLKQMNDRFGHDAGDEVLSVSVATVQKHLRRGDAIARMGGDEFAMLLMEADAPSALGAMNRFRGYLLRAMGDRGWPVTFSIGLVTCVEPPASVEEVVKKADSLMYQVKKSGKNSIAHAIFA